MMNVRSPAVTKSPDLPVSRSVNLPLEISRWLTRTELSGKNLRNVGGTSGAESENPELFCGPFGTSGASHIPEVFAILTVPARYRLAPTSLRDKNLSIIRAKQGIAVRLQERWSRLKSSAPHELVAHDEAVKVGADPRRQSSVEGYPQALPPTERNL